MSANDCERRKIVHIICISVSILYEFVHFNKKKLKFTSRMSTACFDPFEFIIITLWSYNTTKSIKKSQRSWLYLSLCSAFTPFMNLNEVFVIVRRKNRYWIKIDCGVDLKEMKWKICLVGSNIRYEFSKTADAKSVWLSACLSVCLSGRSLWSHWKYGQPSSIFIITDEV